MTDSTTRSRAPCSPVGSRCEGGNLEVEGDWKVKKYGLLFWEMFKIALCVVGGGFAILAVADEVFSRKLKWTKEGEIVGHLPIIQMVPGIIAGNTAVYVGRKVAGVPGALCALVGVFLPSVIVFSLVAAGMDFIPLGNRFLDAAFLGLRAALTGIIAAMVVRGWTKSVCGGYGYAMTALATFALAALGVNPALVVATAIACGVVVKFAEPRAGGKAYRSAFWTIPLIFLKYGLIAFGGGYVLVPVYIGDFVGTPLLDPPLTAERFADVMALTQMTPGPIAVNCATYFGYRMAGVPGAFLATLCLLVPGSALLYIALGSLEKFKSSRLVQGILFGVRPVTIALMLNALWAFAGISVWTTEGGLAWHPTATALALFALGAMLFRKLGVVKLIFLCAAVPVAVELCIW